MRPARGLLVDPASGLMHAVWIDNPDTQIVHYCQVPRGATACSLTRNLTRARTPTRRGRRSCCAIRATATST
jgi:hypothetical protein